MDRLKVAQVGGAIKSKHVEDIEFSHRLNFSDFDVIFIDIQYLNESISEELDNVENEELDDLLAQFRNSIAQMKDFYEHGGIVIAFLSDDPMDIAEYLDEDTKDKWNVLEFLHLDVNNFGFEFIEGSAFEYLENLESLNSNFSLRYHYVMEKFDGLPVLRSKKKKDVVGIKKMIGKGACYLIPGFEKAASPDSIASYDAFQYMLNNVVAINKSKLAGNSTPPAWVDEYIIYDEYHHQQQKTVNIKKKTELEKQIAANEETLDRYRNLKRLLYSGDDELENAVEEIFKDMGFNVSVPEGNNDDLHILENGFTAVVEIKGVTKSGTTMHVMQLEKWVTNYGLENEGKQAKGILILNPFRDKRPSDRKETAFPRDMLNFSKPRGHCLMLGQDRVEGE
ncbi:MAG: hypothetical protein EOP48_14175, partial [Sphingobacteriales bacterium]